MIHIGNHLKYLIESKTLSKRDLSVDFKMTEQNLHRILRSEHIKTDLLIKFCDRLEVHPCEFFKDYEAGDGKVPSGITYEQMKTMWEAGEAGKSVEEIKALVNEEQEMYQGEDYKKLYEQSLETISALKDHNETLKSLLPGAKKGA